MTSFPSRQTVREAVAAKILATITDCAAVLDYLPATPEGKSPLCAVATDPRAYRIGTEEERQPFGLIISFWVRQDMTGGRAAAADKMDSLALQLADLVTNNYNGRFVQDPDVYYDDIDGVPYLIEFHYLEIDYWL